MSKKQEESEKVNETIKVEEATGKTLPEKVEPKKVVQESKPIFFISEYRGYSIPNNHPELKGITLDKEVIGSGKDVIKFSPYETFDEQRREMVWKGYIILDSIKNKEKIQFMLEHPDFNKGFKQVSTLPFRFSDGSVLTGAGSLTSQERLIKGLKKDYAAKGQKLAELKAKLFDAGGSLANGISQADLDEYEQIQKEINS